MHRSGQMFVVSGLFPELHQYPWETWSNPWAQQAINEPGVVGLNIGTRPTACLMRPSPDLADLSGAAHVTVELGLQTTYEWDSWPHQSCPFLWALCGDGPASSKLALKAEIVSHLINGPPGGAPWDDADECPSLCDGQWHPGNRSLASLNDQYPHAAWLSWGATAAAWVRAEYVSIVCDQLEIIPEHIVIHRITGDALRDMLIGPWSPSINGSSQCH